MLPDESTRARLAPSPGPGSASPGGATSPVELVFRFRVPDGRAKPFTEAVERWVSSARRPAEGAAVLEPEARVDLCQPVLGSHPEVWELRLTFSSLTVLGGVLDHHQGLLAAVQLLGGDGVTSLDVPNPLLRRLQFGSASTTDTLARSGRDEG